MRYIVFSICLVLGAWLASAQTQSQLTKADIDRWMWELSNGGRWGKQDQLGAINLITAAKRKQAAGLVREGFAVSLARDTDKEKSADNPSPFSHTMLWTGTNTPGQFSLDNYAVTYHGYAQTHIDALCHMFYQGKMYNGFAQDTVTMEGCAQLAIAALKNGFFTRGVLMDIPRLKGVEYLEPGTPIYPADLGAWEKKAGFKVESGDIVFIRTGRWARRAAKGPWNVAEKAAGLHASCAPWLRKRDVAILGSDAASDVAPSGVAGVAQPVHQLVLIAMGTPIFDNCDLEALAQAAGERKRWTFLLTASPLRVPAGTGSPLNPIAVF